MSFWVYFAVGGVWGIIGDLAGLPLWATLLISALLGLTISLAAG